MENSNVKSNKGLVIFLIIIVILLGTCLGLLLGGVVKNPFVKETKCNVTETKDTKKADTKEEKTTRYYQAIGSESDYIESDGNAAKKTFELVLEKDGTAKIDGYAVNDYESMTGKYVEDDNYVFVTLNNSKCTEGGENNIAGACSTTMVLIKENKVLKYQSGELFHFDIDNVNDSLEYIEVKKADLKSDLKN